MKRLIATTAALILLLAAVPTAADAAEQVDPQVAYALDAVPGGEVVDARTAYWPELGMTLTVPDLRLRDAIGTCPNGSVCAYKGTNLTSTRLSWTTCTTHSTTALGAPARSIADARSTGYLQARNGTTVVATAVAQSWNNVGVANDNVRCVL